MARRQLQEINAGSMADIAFLLLIFFLVTTTMEIDAGIGANLPLKTESPPTPPVPERNVLEIKTNLNNHLMVENKDATIETLKEEIRHFYTDNIDGYDHNPDMPMYTTISINLCDKAIAQSQLKLTQLPNNRFYQQELNKWSIKRKICLQNGGSYKEISKSAVIRLECNAKTTYGTYMAIQNTLKQVVNELRAEQCKAFGWPSYYQLKPTNEDHQEKLRILRILVPERLIESRI